jgi:integrase
MEQRLSLYRNHTPACIYGYTKPILEGDTTVKDCTCPINASGYLKNELNEDGTQKRIRHRSVDTKLWDEARQTRERWLAWGQTTQPVSGLEKLRRPDVTLAEGVKFFKDFGAYQDTKGENTDKKYTTLFNGRLLPWCQNHGVRFIREFDEPVTVKQFFMSWRNLQPLRGKAAVLESTVELATSTKRAELERFRSFLEFCRSNGWIKENYAKSPHLAVGMVQVTKKYAPTTDEFNDITATLENWKGDHRVAKEQLAFCMCLAFTGQRISDVVMFNDETFVCEDGQWFAELTQIKTGNHVKVPIEAWLVDMVKELPFLGESAAKVVVKPSRYRADIVYGRRFWFWRLNGSQKSSTSYRTNAKNYSDKVSMILKRTIKARTARITEETTTTRPPLSRLQISEAAKFEHNMTPHCFRHWFAAMHLQNGVDIRSVSEWLGHANEDITRKHYAHYNSDAYKESARQYNGAMSRLRDKLTLSRFAKFESEPTKPAAVKIHLPHDAHSTLEL